MSRQLGIFGSSGMAKECRDITDELGLEAVFIARAGEDLAQLRLDAPVISESDLARYADLACVIGVGEPALRRTLARRHASRRFANLIHPAASFGRGQRERVERQQGVIVCAGARLSCDIAVGDFTLFNLNSTVNHDCLIGDFATLSPQACVLGNVAVGEGAWVGAGAVIHQGTLQAKLSLGAFCVIGAGAVVLSDCQAEGVYAGVPARKLS